MVTQDYAQPTCLPLRKKTVKLYQKLVCLTWKLLQAMAKNTSILLVDYFENFIAQ